MLGRCTVEWCEVGDRPHTRHEKVKWTGIGASVTAAEVEHGMTAQFTIFSNGGGVHPALTIIDESRLALPQWNVELTWSEMWKLKKAIEEVGKSAENYV